MHIQGHSLKFIIPVFNYFKFLSTYRCYSLKIVYDMIIKYLFIIRNLLKKKKLKMYNIRAKIAMYTVLNIKSFLREAIEL